MKTAFCFNLDGTITTMDVLPCLASELSVADEMATLTRATSSGLIEFDASLRLRSLILSQVPAEIVHSIVASIPLNERLVSFIRARQNHCFLITGNLDIWAQAILHKCGCTMYASSTHFLNNKVVLGSITNKHEAVSEIRSQGYERIVAVGSGAHDAPMLSAADVAIAFGGSTTPAPQAVTVSNYVIHEEDALCKLLTAL